ncbi:MAG: hypothetical protein AAGJ93_12520, partial [Bacteroidota bacterium]
MKKLFSLLLGGILLAWSSCSCPPNEKVGDLTLTETAIAFLPYDGNEVLTFVDETGTELKLQTLNGRETQENQLCTRTTCTEASYGSPSSCEYYAAESRRYTFNNEDQTILIDLLLYTEVYERNDATFYDALQAAFSAGTPNIVGHHLIEGRFDDAINLSNINLTDFLTPVENIELNGTPFTDILQYEEGELALYLQAGTGIIGFKNADHL